MRLFTDRGGRDAALVQSAMLPLSVCEGRLLGWVRTSLGLCAVSMLAPEEGRRVCLASLTLGPALLALIQPVRDDATVVARLRAAATPIELVSALQHVADSLAQEAITITCSSDSSVTDEISRLGWSRIASINQQLTRVCVTCLDEAHRVHELELTLSEDYPRTPPSLLADLPLPLALPRWTALQDIRYAVTEFEYALHKYQAYLNAMDALAADTWVLEPQTLPSYAISQRRLAIDESTSVVIDVNPDTPSAVCIAALAHMSILTVHTGVQGEGPGPSRPYHCSQGHIQLKHASMVRNSTAAACVCDEYVGMARHQSRRIWRRC